jgi:hypothetical protein
VVPTHDTALLSVRLIRVELRFLASSLVLLAKQLQIHSAMVIIITYINSMRQRMCNTDICTGTVQNNHVAIISSRVEYVMIISLTTVHIKIILTL